MINLQPKISTAPYGIPPCIFGSWINILLEPLRIIFNLIIKTSTYPSNKRSQKCVQFLKMVTLICILSKILESIFIRNIFTFSLWFQAPIRILQKTHSTFSQCVKEALEDGLQFDVTYSDFNKVDYNILLQKLRSHGISSSLLHLFKSSLKDRDQYVVYKDKIIFKLLFNVLWGPTGCQFRSLTYHRCLLFADYFKIFKRISNITDCRLLQEGLINIHACSDKNKMSFNINKCYVIIFTF